MSGPIWRTESNRKTTCVWCLRETTGVMVEGEVRDGTFHERKVVCQGCFVAFKDYLLEGERNQRAEAPAYAHR